MGKVFPSGKEEVFTTDHSCHIFLPGMNHLSRVAIWCLIIFYLLNLKYCCLYWRKIVLPGKISSNSCRTISLCIVWNLAILSFGQKALRVAAWNRWVFSLRNDGEAGGWAKLLRQELSDKNSYLVSGYGRVTWNPPNISVMPEVTFSYS